MLVHCTDKVLKTVADPVEFPVTDYDLGGIVEQMLAVLKANNGIAIAAPQIGIPKRIIAMGDADAPIIMINPKIVSTSAETTTDEEGCLSFPGLFIKIRRFSEVRVRFTDINGNTDTQLLRGLSARVVQHEIDHLDGILFTRRAHKSHLQSAYTQQKKLNRQRKKNEAKRKAI
jgi:peptide deformylase